MDQIENPLFKGSEIASLLGYKNTRKAIIDHIEQEDKIINKLNSNEKLGFPKMHPQTIFINESGVYSLIFSQVNYQKPKNSNIGSQAKYYHLFVKLVNIYIKMLNQKYFSNVKMKDNYRKQLLIIFVANIQLFILLLL